MEKELLILVMGALLLVAIGFQTYELAVLGTRLNVLGGNPAGSAALGGAAGGTNAGAPVSAGTGSASSLPTQQGGC